MAVIQKARTFINEVVVETRKVTWPQRDDLKESTMVVIISVTILSLILGVVDKILAIILQQILRMT